MVRRYSPRVFATASRFFRQRSLVEEAAQEVFLKAFTQLGSFEGRGSMEGWLTKITTNTCLNMLRGSKRRPELTVSDLSDEEDQWLEDTLTDSGQPSVENSVVAADLADRLLSVLSPEDQQALLMIDGEQASVKEVAEATGWSESKVKVRAFRARKKVREAMERLLGAKQEPATSESR
ncbi:MAG TPA: RNA polymerase sigma factor [Pyrinomonadaceae bacterium]|nr:RNA polymerase sigma factor [Pyrinomonadaceae bacterium]